MSFNSYLFLLLFLPTTLIGYNVTTKRNNVMLSKAFLLFASLFFYGSYNLNCLLILIVSILCNYLFFLLIKKNKKKSLFIMSIVFNIGLLSFFKYSNFIINNINLLFKCEIGRVDIIMPLAISFFTFSNISFLADTYKGEIGSCSFLDYSLYVCFLAKLIQGPLMKYADFNEQLNNSLQKNVDWENIEKGVFFFMFGMIKKVLLADTFAKAADWGFNNISHLDTLNGIIIVLSYTLQIYFDFSGYSDMAYGVGKMFNMDLPLNFNFPYLAVSITDFWKRWHKSLTRFLTEYIYIPLGGNRKGEIRTYINILIVFIISGLWHGPSWTFVLWGFVNGILMVINRKYRNKLDKCPTGMMWLITFVLINILWIVFRADTIGNAILIMKNICSFKFKELDSELINCFSFTELDFVPEEFLFIRFFKTSRLYIIVYLLISALIIMNEEKIVKSFHSLKVNSLYIFLLIVFFIYSVLSFTSNNAFVYAGF